MNTISPRKKVKTRKPHRCFGCLRDFPAGSELTRAVFAHDGSAYGTYTCPVCEALFADWPSCDREDGFGEGELRYEDNAVWEAKRVEIEGE